MITNPEQFVQLQKSALEAFQDATAASIAGFERLAALNVQATKTSFEESAETLRTLVDVKDPKQWADLATTSVQPTTDKVAAYYKHVYEIANETGSELARLFERQYAESNRQIYAAIDAFARNLPVGSEGVVTLMKQAVSAANTTFDQMNKATKQAVEVAEANMAAAAKTTSSATATAATRAAQSQPRKSA
ncbi:MAG: TIGR01841 family phasin [Burkholderiaceae bacterium]|nr:TIGR01841 family phasin [Burkholderiaceae bacterium]